MWILAIALLVIDCAQTLWLLRKGWHEKNPAIRWLWHRGEGKAVLCYFAAVAAFVAYFGPTEPAIAAVVAAIELAAVLWNLKQGVGR